MQKSVTNPQIPYVGPTWGPLTPGKLIKIQGYTSMSSNRFNINLQCGPSSSPNTEIALHVAVHLEYDYIARNTCHADGWDEEQSDGGLPISRGQAFEILILCEPQSYKIAINGRHFTEYFHKIPFGRVTHLGIEGDVSINQILYEGGSGGDGNMVGVNTAGGNKVSMPRIPYVGVIQGGFGLGKLVKIEGNVPPMANRFNINLQCGPNTSPSDEIALHMAVHLEYDFIARNSYHVDGWDEEQNFGPSMIKRGQPFQVLILAEPNNFKIAINGQHFCEFPQRIPLQRITHLAIDGEVVINEIAFEGGNQPQNAPFGMPPGGAFPNSFGQPPCGPPPGCPPPGAAPGFGSPAGALYGPPPPYGSIPFGSQPPPYSAPSAPPPF